MLYEIQKESYQFRVLLRNVQGFEGAGVFLNIFSINPSLFLHWQSHLHSLNCCIDFFAFLVQFSFRHLFYMFICGLCILFSVFCCAVYISAINRIYRRLLKVNWFVWILLNRPTSSAQVLVCGLVCVHVWACISLYTLCDHETAWFQRPVERFKGLANEQVIFPQISMNSRANFVCACLFVCMCVTATVGLEVMSRGLRLS